MYGCSYGHETKLRYVNDTDIESGKVKVRSESDKMKYTPPESEDMSVFRKISPHGEILAPKTVRKII